MTARIRHGTISALLVLTGVNAFAQGPLAQLGAARTAAQAWLQELGK